MSYATPDDVKEIYGDGDAGIVQLLPYVSNKTPDELIQGRLDAASGFVDLCARNAGYAVPLDLDLLDAGHASMRALIRRATAVIAMHMLCVGNQDAPEQLETEYEEMKAALKGLPRDLPLARADGSASTAFGVAGDLPLDFQPDFFSGVWGAIGR